MFQRAKFPAAVAAALFILLIAIPVYAQDDPKDNKFWWPEKLDLTALRQHSAESDPMGAKFD